MSEIRRWLEAIGLGQYADAPSRRTTSTGICSSRSMRGVLQPPLGKQRPNETRSSEPPRYLPSMVFKYGLIGNAPATGRWRFTHSVE
jgi:hypothetical protein